MNLEGKRIVLTGAASGIGKALLIQLVNYPAQIIAVDLNPFEANFAPSKADIIPLTADLGQQSEVDRLFAFALEKMGGIDLFIANAGFAYYEKIGAADWAHIDAIFRVNVYSPLYAAVKMRDLHTDNRPYCVVITASAMSYLAVPGYAYYSATKAALDRFAEAYRFELPTLGRLMLVYPIATRTNFFSRASGSTPLPFPAQTADYVARRIMAGLKNDRNSVHPSVIFRVFWSISRVFSLFGRLYQQIYARQMP